MNIQLWIEIAVTLIVFGIQIHFFARTLKKINIVAELFPAKAYSDEDIREQQVGDKPIKLLVDNDTRRDSGYKVMIMAINRYLEKNHGVTDFAIVKNIVDRKIESMENLVMASISLPVYTGLMGTFLGIIGGLIGVAFRNIDEPNIKSFIGGVLIAMAASFMGLLLTVINNAFHLKNAKAKCDERRNDFYNFLEAELLPHLENSIYASLESLKTNVNAFNKTFKDNIDKFDDVFGKNVTDLVGAVLKISGDMATIVESTKTQKEFIQQLNSIGSLKTAEANLKVFSIIKEAGPNLVEFIEKQKELTTSIEKSHSFVAIIADILNRVKTFEENINKLGENINSEKYLNNKILNSIDENLNYLDKQYQLTRRYGAISAESIEGFFKEEHLKIKTLIEKIKFDVENALNLKISENPFQKLNYLESLQHSFDALNSKLDNQAEFSAVRAELESIRTGMEAFVREANHPKADSDHVGFAEPFSRPSDDTIAVDGLGPYQNTAFESSTTTLYPGVQNLVDEPANSMNEDTGDSALHAIPVTEADEQTELSQPREGSAETTAADTEIQESIELAEADHVTDEIPAPPFVKSPAHSVPDREAAPPKEGLAKRLKRLFQ